MNLKELITLKFYKLRPGKPRYKPEVDKERKIIDQKKLAVAQLRSKIEFATISRGKE